MRTAYNDGLKHSIRKGKLIDDQTLLFKRAVRIALHRYSYRTVTQKHAYSL